MQKLKEAYINYWTYATKASEEDEENPFHWSDIVVLAAYFVFVLAVGLWFSFRSSRDSVSGYFLASRNMHWLPVGASLFASNIGSSHFVGLAGSGAAGGVAIAAFELVAIFVLQFLGWVFAPVYMASGIYTMPEYLRKRFGGKRIQIYMSLLALALSIFTKISVDLFSGALFIKIALGWNIYGAIILILGIATIFTILGGLTAVVWTDFVQTILMIIGAFILMILTFNEVGGYTNLVTLYMAAETNDTLYDANGVSCGKTPDYAMHFIRSLTPGESDYPWFGLIFGSTVSTVWYWCSDQVIVQRVLASKSMTYAKAATIVAGYIKFLPLFLLVFPGMAAKHLYPNEVGCVIPEICREMCGASAGCTNHAYPRLVMDLMPNGLRGLMMAVMMAALMSSLTSIFNSSATIFTIDIWKNIRSNASEYEQLFVGRLFVLVMVGISIVWIPVIEASQDSQLFNYIQSITSFLSPPVAAVYLLAIFYDRTNETGAFWSLVIGLAIGAVRFGLEYGYTVPACGSTEIDDRPHFVKIFVDKIHYLHFGIIMLVFSVIVAVVISLLTKPIHPKHLHRLTWNTRKSQVVRIDLDEEVTPHEEMKKLIEKEEHDSDARKEPPAWRKMLNFICGFDTTQDDVVHEPPIPKEEEAKKAAEFLDEDPFQAKLVNWMGVIVIVFSGFIWGFYA